MAYLCKFNIFPPLPPPPPPATCTPSTQCSVSVGHIELEVHAGDSIRLSVMGPENEQLINMPVRGVSSWCLFYLTQRKPFLSPSAAYEILGSKIGLPDVYHIQRGL